MQRSKKSAVLVHCTIGQDRTGYAIAMYLMRKYQVPWTEALADAAAHGFHPYEALWRALAREAGW